MLSKFKGLIAAGAVLLMSAGVASAAGVQFRFDTARYSSADGGEFMAIFTNPTPSFQNVPVRVDDFGLGGITFQTFCLELDEVLYPDHEFDATISLSATLGGLGGAIAGQDPISSETAYLFDHFSKGTLTTPYNYALGAGRVADATSLQNAFWYLEDEFNVEYPTLAALAGADPKAAAFVAEAQAAVGTTWFGLGDVKVLNVWDDPTHTVYRQDVLIIVPTPAAATLGLGLLTPMAMYALRRRKA